jgi:hypothetical protein
MKREIKITVKKDHNHYALIEQVNNKENEINRGIFLDKDQYEQLRQHFVSGSLLTDDYIRKIADDYANQYYSKDANPISHESLTEPFIDGFKKAMELLSNDH